MRALSSCILAVGSVAVALALADATPSTVSPPACGLLCIDDALSRSVCAPTNKTCVCTNQRFLESFASCVSKNCSVRDSLTTEKYTKESCGAPVVDRTKVVSAAGLVGGSLAFVAVALRILAKLRVAGGFLGLDDLCILGTALINLPFTVFSVLLANRGLGRDIWEVPFDNITYILYLYFWDELIYQTILPLTKISILIFYLRIFPGKTFRNVAWTLMACNTAYWITFIIISVFQCRPIPGAWTRWDGTFEGTCNNINLQGWMSAGINLVLDISTLCLPATSLYKLNLSRKKKFQVFLMFGVGFFVTIVSVLRLQSLIQFANTTNLTQDYVTLGYWSTIEVHVGIICACMPAIRQLLRYHFPSSPGSTLVHSVQPPVLLSSKTRRPSSVLMRPGIHGNPKHDEQSSTHELIGLAN